MSNQTDPELADLLGLDSVSKPVPDFDSLMGTSAPVEQEGVPEELAAAVKKTFAPISKFEEAPKPLFQDKNFYKTILGDEGEPGQRVHATLTSFINAKDAEDRTLYRNRLIPAYWDLGSAVVRKIGQNLSLPKRLMLRFGILSPSFLSQEQRDMLSRIIFNNQTDEPVYYTDEWFGKIATGDVGQSSQEEVKAVKKTENQRKIDIIDKRKVSRSAELTILNNKNIERKGYEAELLRTVQALMSHERRPEMDGVEEAYSNEQKGSFSQITELIRKLSLVDKEVARSIMRIEGLDREIEDLSGKVEGVTMVTRVDVDTIVQEFNTVRQMAKLCVGRQGNHFPILMKQYFRPSMTEMATRENVINIMTEIEYLDPELFMRTYKRQITRIVPYLIIIPSYGEQGICWEPFDRKNRLTGRGRVALPMFPKNLREAIIYALADLRWQVAKEKAMHYWMEEGFTGRYYQWFDSKKLKGDVKDYFIRDYLLWITKESEGTQKLDKDVRGIFWRMLPFPQEVKDKLRNRGFVFNELYKKDMNRAMSDGY